MLPFAEQDSGGVVLGTRLPCFTHGQLGVGNIIQMAKQLARGGPPGHAIGPVVSGRSAVSHRIFAFEKGPLELGISILAELRLSA